MQEDHESKLRDAPRTRILILRAAQQAFSHKGYSAAGVRDITAAAGVNPSLVSRYFGSKESLFREALQDLLKAENITGLAPERFGIEVLYMLMRRTDTVTNPMAMMVLASADEKARQITQNLLMELVLTPFTNWFGAARGQEKALRFMILASGLTLYTQLYPMGGLTPAIDPNLQAWLENSFQQIIVD